MKINRSRHGPQAQDTTVFNIFRIVTIANQSRTIPIPKCIVRKGRICHYNTVPPPKGIDGLKDIACVCS